MFNNENINNKSCERDFLNRSLIDNSKSRICYVDLREKYFGNEIEAYKKAKLEQEYEEKVNRLFELRSEARRQFVHSVNIEPDKITVNKDEEALIERILDAINQNMDNTEYTVDQLAREIGMSRANFYKKMQSMLGITPNEFLRNVRLKHAAHLLAETNYPVNQISLMVGFLTPRYFSQCFKKMFGVLPSEYGGRTSE